MTHKAILIDPIARTVTEVDQEPGLKQIYERLSVEGFRPVHVMDAVAVAPGREFMYIDDEGMLIPGLPTFAFAGSNQPFAGRGLIVRGDDEGDDTDTNLTAELVASKIVWLDLLSTGNIGPGGEITPPEGFDWAYKVGDPILKDRDEA